MTLVADAHTTDSMRLDDGTTIAAPHVVAELNLAMTWLDDPGRRNGIASAADVRFGDGG